MLILCILATNPTVLRDKLYSVYTKLILNCPVLYMYMYVSANYDCLSLLLSQELKVLGKSVGLCKTTKRKDQLYISFILVSV